MGDGVACVSWYRAARWDPDNVAAEGDRPPASLVLRRSTNVLAHEMCHLFGLQHCIYRHCLMNGSNHQMESDTRPPFLCAVCLRKLFLALTQPPGAKPARAPANDAEAAASRWISERYAALQRWHDAHGLHEPQLVRLAALATRQGIDVGAAGVRASVDGCGGDTQAED